MKKKKDVEQSPVLVYFSAASLVTATVLGLMLAGSATVTPNLPAHVYGPFQNVESSDIELVFNQSSIQEVNNRLDEDREFGWCLSTDGVGEDRFNVSLREGEDMSRSSGSVSFSCSVWEMGRLHTHPNIWSVPYPSEHDRDVFRDSSWRFDCVAAGRVKIEEKPIGLNCYQKSNEDLEKVAVVVE